MIPFFKDKLIKLSRTGIDKDLPLIEAFRVKLLNWTMIFGFITVFVHVIESSISHGKGALIIWLLLVVPSIPVLLNHFKKYLLARLYITFFFPTILFVFALLYGEGAGIGYTFFVFILAALICFNNWKLITLNLVYIAFLFGFSTYYSRTYGNIYSDDVNFMDLIICIAATVSIISWGMFYALREIKLQQLVLLERNTRLHNQNKELEELNYQNKVKSELLSIVAHDLRSPAIAFNRLSKKISYLIKKNDPERLVTLAGHFEQTGNKLFYNLDNVLSWVISQKDNIHAEYSSFKPHKLTKEIMEDLVHLTEEKQQEVLNQIAPEAKLYSDKNMLKVIVRNIIHNAVKYSPERSAIKVDFCENQERSQIVVSDSGKGIDEAVIAKIRNNESKNKISSQGYGLGLMICFSFIKQLQGEINIENADKGGAKVIIQLPKN